MSSGEPPSPWRNRIVGHGEEAPESLLANPLNFRIHPKPQQDALSGGLNALGWIAEVLVNRRSQTVIDGHLRVELAISRGEPMVPVTYVDLSPEEERLALLTLDPISAMAAQDAEKLEALLAEVEAQEPGLQAMLDDLAKRGGIGLEVLEEDEAPVDQAAELMAKWGTARGQLWEVGKHRIFCGDSTSEQDAKLLLDGIRPALLHADPPYGMNLRGYAGGDNVLHGHTLKQRTVSPVTGDNADFDPQPTVKMYGDTKEQFWWGGDWYYPRLPSNGSWIIWDKRTSEAADAVLGAPFEVCWSRQRHERRFIRHVWGGIFNKERGEPSRWHPTQKPVGVVGKILEWHSNPDDVVMDPFLGSGTTLVAAEQLGRKVFGMEIEPKYVAVSLERLERLGVTPKLLTSASS